MPTAMVVEDEGGFHPRTKEGQKCCGCCCDTRRAVIVVNSIMSVLVLLSTVFLFAGVELIEAAAATADDDEVKKAGEELQQLPMGLIVATNVCLIGLFVAGIMGAVNYNPTLVKCAASGYVLKFALDLFQVNIGGMILDGFFFYPHFFFLKEMNDNIMTPENYPNETHCCC